jgi:hypothetical protein
MSERIQKNARERAERARTREKNAHQCARNNRERGEHHLAQLHENSALAHADAARRAEDTIAADQRIEGNRLHRSN